jgi:hypothetical protein
MNDFKFANDIYFNFIWSDGESFDFGLTPFSETCKPYFYYESLNVFDKRIWDEKFVEKIINQQWNIINVRSKR